MQLYRFSPIQNQNQLFEAVDYVAKQTTRLCQKIIGHELPIGYLTIFSHYQVEFENLKKIISSFGKIKQGSHGPYVIFKDPIQLPNNMLEKMRIRQPDPYRMQVGCVDFIVPDYQEFMAEHLNKYPNNLRVIDRPDLEMVEFYDPDFDVLAYVTLKK